MSAGERIEKKETAAREMYAHLADLHRRCDDLLAARDPFGVYNAIQPLRSLIGQIDSAARRYKSAC